MNALIDGKDAELVMDQIKSLDKLRIGNKMCDLSTDDIALLKQRLKEMLIDWVAKRFYIRWIRQITD